VAHSAAGQDWGLPDEAIDVIGFHHAPEEADWSASPVGTQAATSVSS